MVIEPEGKKSAITDSVLAEIWDNEKDATYDQEEKPPILNDTERKKFYHNAPLIGNRKGFTTSWYDVDKVLEAQRDDTWQKASLIYEAKIEKARAERAIEILEQLERENPWLWKK